MLACVGLAACGGGAESSFASDCDRLTDMNDTMCSCISGKLADQLSSEQFDALASAFSRAESEDEAFEILEEDGEANVISVFTVFGAAGECQAELDAEGVETDDEDADAKGKGG